MSTHMRALSISVAKVVKFNQICMLLEANSKQAAVLRALPTFACLVQGCWVVKRWSAFLFREIGLFLLQCL